WGKTPAIPSQGHRSNLAAVSSFKGASLFVNRGNPLTYRQLLRSRSFAVHPMGMLPDELEYGSFASQEFDRCLWFHFESCWIMPLKTITAWPRLTATTCSRFRPLWKRPGKRILP